MQPLRAGLATLRAALATPELRRLQAAWAATSLGTWSFFVVIAIYAFDKGGAAAESTYVVTMAIGSALAGAAVGLLGVEATLLATATTLVLLALATGRTLARLEASVPIPEREFRLLRGLGMFAPLPIATLETLAARLEPVRVAAGDVVVREGDPGDRCYVVAEGRIELSKRSGWQASMGPGDLFGEIALLRDTPRTATAVATGPGLLLALASDDFLAAVTGHVRTREAADALVSERLAEPLVGGTA